jgi:cation diffusion facilitator family transporter
VPDDSDQSRGNSTDESVGTVLIAGGANLAIAVAKLAGGLISGSTAMLAEAAHSFADTLNQVFLMAALKRSQKPADAQHPFGYGMERYFWSLIAAVGIFVLGAGYSIVEGLKAVFHAEPLGSLTVSYVVLGLGVVFEGTSWWRAVRQLSGEAEERDRGFFEHLRITSDPTAKTVAFEDTAALVGLVLAAAGLGLHQLTGNAYWDASAAIAIGVLLAVVAYVLGRDTKEMLIGEAAPAELREGIRQSLDEHAEVDRVVEIRTMLIGPEALLVAARLDMDDALGAADVEDRTDAIAAELQKRFPQVREVYLDVTSRPGTQVAAIAPDPTSASSTTPSTTR